MLDQVDRRFAKSRVDRLAIDSRSSRSKFFKVELIVFWSTNRHLILTCLRIIIVDDTTQVSAIRFGHLCTLQYWRVDTIRDASLPKIKKKFRRDVLLYGAMRKSTFHYMYKQIVICWNKLRTCSNKLVICSNILLICSNKICQFVRTNSIICMNKFLICLNK